MINQIDSGATIEYTNATGADIASGDLVVVGKMCGVAVADIANTASGILSIKGKFTLTKKTAADVLAQGAILIYDAGVEAIGAAGDLDSVIVGRVAVASVTLATTVEVVLGL